MLKDITLGQFFPGDSLLHKTDARIKLLVFIAFVVAAVSASSAYSFAFLFLLTTIIALLSKIPLRVILKNLKMLIFVLAFTAVINIFFIKGEKILFDFYFIEIYKEGLVFAFYMIIRLVSLVTGSFIILSYTTSPLDLTDAIERSFSPFGFAREKVHTFAMIMTIALRFIPTLMEETDKIISAQKARGSDFESGGLVHRVKAIIPILIPLFASAIRRAEELASAMECRCYRGGEGRTKMKILKTHYYDYVFLAVMVLCAVSVFLLNGIGVS